MRTRVLEKPVTQTYEEIRQRVATQQPVDRRGRLDGLCFMPGDATERGAAKLPEPSLIPLAMPGDTGIGVGRIMLSPLAFKQLLARVDYPYKLYQRLPPNMNFHVINTLLQGLGEDRLAMIRLINGNQARAVLGSRYVPMDDITLLGLAMPYLEGATVRYESFGEVSSHISLTWPEPVEIGGQKLFRGLHLMNSEVGHRSITVESLLWRPVCNNILPSVGFGGEDGIGYGKNGKVYRRGERNADEGTVQSGWRFYHTGDVNRLADFVKDAVIDSKRAVEGLLARWREGLQREIGDPIKAIETVSKVGQLTADQLRNVLNAYVEEGATFGRTFTGVANAFTLAAQVEADNEERYKLQALGTHVLTDFMEISGEGIKVYRN